MITPDEGQRTDADWQADSRRFDGVAADYDVYRPAYPDELIEALIGLANLRPDSKILEIGSGTGKATQLLAPHGFAITCIEQGQQLVTVAARKLRQYPRVEFETVAFEQWPVRPHEFDLVVSAQAFHWIPREIGYARAAQALKPHGHLALFWNMAPDPPDAIFLELRQVYQAYAPELAERPNAYEDVILERERAIVESGFFGPVTTRKFAWSARYDTRQYLGLLGTYSDHLRLSDEKRQGLFNGVAQVIQKHGGYLEKPYVAVLYVASLKTGDE